MAAISLFTATLAPGIALLVLGALLFWNGSAVAQTARQSLRSTPVTLVIMGAASAWFLYEVAHLGEADFGSYRKPLFAFFLAVAVLSYFYVRDFLAVRGAAILVLMTAKLLLEAAFMEEPGGRLFMVAFVYLCIVAALYLGTLPYRARDICDWLFARSSRARGTGTVLLVYGLVLCGIAFSY
jgi:hypothetical protein